MSGKRNRRSSSLSDLIKKFKFTEDIPDASPLLAESPPTASTLRARSPSIELASENQHLECRCSVSVERAASLISATKSLASRLEDLTYSLERLPVEPFSVAFFSAFSGKQTARIESIRDLSIAELNALSLGDLLATVFKLKHNLVMERAKIMEADVVAYLQGLGLLEHMHVFQSWVSRWYCPRTSHLPSVLLVLGGSPPVPVVVSNHDESGFDTAPSTTTHYFQISINIVVDMKFKRTSLFVHLFDEFDELLPLSNFLDQCILLASSEADVHKLRYTMHRKDENGHVCFRNHNDQVDHPCSFKLPTCMFELAAMLPRYVEAISGMPHVGLFEEIARLRDEALFWSCPERLVVTLQDSTEIVALASPVMQNFRTIPEGSSPKTGCCLSYFIGKNNTTDPYCCCLHDAEDIRTWFFTGPQTFGE